MEPFAHALQPISNLMKLKQKKLMPIIVAIIGCAILLAALWLWQSDREYRQLQSLIKTQAAEIDRQLESLAVLPRLLANDPRLTAALKNADSKNLAFANNVLASVRDQIELSQAFLMDTSGRTIAASNHEQENSFVGKFYNFRPYFQQALLGQQSTQYAVGATTGKPGYFVARAVVNQAENTGNELKKPMGVVVLKQSLSHLPEIWKQRSHSSFILDQNGVVILSTDPRILYANTQHLSTEDFREISYLHNYPTGADVALTRLAEAKSLQLGDQNFIASSLQLQNEPWQLIVLSPQSKVWKNTLLYFLAMLAFASVIFLSYRSFRYQQLLAHSEKNNALKLEKQVKERTKELETAQSALIVESNFAVIGRMSAAINHEVNQPLTSLRFNLASLRAMIEKPQLQLNDIRATAIDCDRTTKRISRVVETLRSISRPSQVELGPLNINTLISDVVETINRERQQLSSHLSTRTLPSAVTINGNQVLLQQALLNLLYNASDAVQKVESPSIFLQASVNRDSVDVSVTDNGKGLDAEIQKHMFTPFSQHALNTKGLGLGLALTRQIAERHHGEVLWDSKNNSGSRFTLRLPLLNNDNPSDE